MGERGRSRGHAVRLALAAVLLLAVLTPVADAHRSGCHRWHSCPSDRGTYVCGDLGYCSQCPDNQYCQAGKPRRAGQQQGQGRPLERPLLEGRVTSVIDGDTIRVRIRSQEETVRYIGVNTPETHHPTRGAEPGGQEATAVNRSLVEGKTVRLELDVQERDRYGRLLAYVYDGDTMVNAELLRRGYAQMMTIPPNVRHQERFLALQREARGQGRGLWRQSSSPATTPSRSRSGVPPQSAWICPTTHPIKGNFTTYSGERCIYHTPRGQFYNKTKPERCYATKEEARRDGCRASRR